MVIHIDYRQAPLVIQRFGDIKKLVEQTLDPMISAYFKDIGQTMTLIELIHNRAQIQKRASEEMRAKFVQYNLDLQEVLIGTPGSDKTTAASKPSSINCVPARWPANRSRPTPANRRQPPPSANSGKPRPAPRSRPDITKSELSISIRENEGKADLARSQQHAHTIRILADAEADKVKSTALGEASRIRAVAGADAERVARMGVSQAMAIEEQVRAYGGPRYQLTQQVMERFATAVEHSGVELVPRVVMNGSGNTGSGGTNMIEALLAVMMSDRLGDGGTADPVTRNPATQELVSRLRRETTSALSGGKT